MKLLFTILLLISTFFFTNAENSSSTVPSSTQTSGKPLIEVVEGLVYQTADRQYFRAYIINNTEYLEFHNVTIGCLDCYGNSDQYEVSPPLIKNSDGTYTLPTLHKKSYETFAYNGPHSAKWYVISSQ
ncbi:expressed protein [Dictyostelium purpureum]|uniref:Expressed protein n=1 Tax=Dictyostelium purpureum TaxID=5786 RepID=F1A0Z4_DICPU|nr:uncharacterized protein DICPUDRAFT_99626 [Dictyostelium purpureum]EGC30129.1 expressed protein [Dictyostelium purpureum]|eukprot:XP_003293337.1 expressed protein [Dictyostelium purpureum]